LIAHKFNTQWVDGGCGEEWKRGRVFLVRLQSSIGRESDTYYWTQKVNREDYDVDQYWVLLAVVKESTRLKNN
jgi:hypothetical protein